jgi:hypothetical protein
MARTPPFPLLRRTRVTRLVLIQAIKRLPLNLRPLLGVPKLENPKALALGLMAATRLADAPGWPEAQVEAGHLVSRLLELAVPTTHGLGWGYPFDWQARVAWMPRNTPTVVCTGFVVRALDGARTLFRDGSDERRKVEDAISAASEFVRKDLNRTQMDRGFCWSYSPLDDSVVVNATLLGAEVLARSVGIHGRGELLDELLPTVQWSLAQQDDEGGWAYGRAHHHKWEDSFHTGFNLMSLEAIRDAAAAAGRDAHEVVPMNRLRLGHAHFSTAFIDEKGRPWYYRHQPYPLDSHAAAVAMLTLMAGERFPELGSAGKADAVLDWSLRHLWSDRGYFIYQRRRRSTVKTPFLRWSQAWMLLALAEWCAGRGVLVTGGGGRQDGHPASSE